MGLFGHSYNDLCKKGREALESGDEEKASEHFLQAIRNDQSKPRAFAWLGMTYQEAVNAFLRQDEPVKAKEYGELAIRAFDEAIRRETDPALKAEEWWQRGVTLGAMDRTSERDASWNEAEKAVPGFSSKRKGNSLDALEQAINDVTKSDNK